ncbi:hypothetical protein DFA_09658 [Cavenderia fasciculata]|uniref:Uncharacterized protein n=1 Tax=Cavenderia fasciculata TaxID=261658 RepID=F4Q886_CACFS|nr:uncharacterized protein DFA_09658 [Cavenderia fasciculata]EGG15986.1 hypothetical protein DFA_09658 [Cavenderia fasciculata]|eukprot:XP_004352311.1 hypothetical protein DFA_09658 [Cavenderia fasciculata]
MVNTNPIKEDNDLPSIENLSVKATNVLITTPEKASGNMEWKSPIGQSILAKVNEYRSCSYSWPQTEKMIANDFPTYDFSHDRLRVALKTHYMKEKPTANPNINNDNNNNNNNNNNENNNSISIDTRQHPTSNLSPDSIDELSDVKYLELKVEFFQMRTLRAQIKLQKARQKANATR